MLLIKFALKFLKILNKEASPAAIASGLAFGAIIGLTPKGSLHNIGILILILFLKTNISAAFLGAGIFTVFAYIFDPVFNKVGYALLTQESLQALWTNLYNTPIVPWSNFNNTLTLGSLICALILFLPLFFIFKWLVSTYREKVLVNIQKIKFVQFLKASKWYNIYQSYD